MKDEKSKITIEVPIELKTALETKATVEDSDLSKVCRKILRQHIESNPPPVAQAVAEHEEAA